MPKYKRERAWIAFCWVNGRARRYRVVGMDPTDARAHLKERIRQEGLELESTITLVPLTKENDQDLE